MNLKFTNSLGQIKFCFKFNWGHSIKYAQPETMYLGLKIMFRGYRGYTHCCLGSMNYSQNHSENPTTLSRPSVLYIVLLLIFGCTTPTAFQGIHLDLCHWIFPGVLRGPYAVLAIEPNLATSKHPTSCTYYLFRPSKCVAEKPF